MKQMEKEKKKHNQLANWFSGTFLPNVGGCSKLEFTSLLILF